MLTTRVKNVKLIVTNLIQSITFFNQQLTIVINESLTPLMDREVKVGCMF